VAVEAGQRWSDHGVPAGRRAPGDRPAREVWVRAVAGQRMIYESRVLHGAPGRLVAGWISLLRGTRYELAGEAPAPDRPVWGAVWPGSRWRRLWAGAPQVWEVLSVEGGRRGKGPRRWRVALVRVHEEGRAPFAWEVRATHLLDPKRFRLEHLGQPPEDGA